MWRKYSVEFKMEVIEVWKEHKLCLTFWDQITMFSAFSCNKCYNHMRNIINSEIIRN